MIKIIPVLFLLLVIPSDISPAVREIDPNIDPNFEQIESAFMSAVQSYVIVELATNEISDDLLSVKIIEMMGRSPYDIYLFIYQYTGGDVPEIFKDYYPWTGPIDPGIERIKA